MNNPLGVPSEKTQYIYRHYPNWGWPPSLPPYFWQIYFWQSVDHVDLPPSPRIFDKKHEILGCETYIHYRVPSPIWTMSLNILFVFFDGTPYRAKLSSLKTCCQPERDFWYFDSLQDFFIIYIKRSKKVLILLEQDRSLNRIIIISRFEPAYSFEKCVHHKEYFQFLLTKYW